MSWNMGAGGAAAGSMPTGQWNVGAGMALPAVDAMAGCTPEQWTLMQQQNWQQWAQWQQQYAQWQSQYGEKYAQQMQMQAMAAGGMPPMAASTAPPLPVGGAPVAPPPPPHENNQPLYANNSVTAPPAPAPSSQQGYGVPAGNAWQTTDAGTVNADALEKLAEEARLFDIQFQKWEEEIEIWKRDNDNHPDKQAYKEYEAKFEACRLQLLERRQHMNARKARLLGIAPENVAGNAPTPNVNATASVTHAYEKSAPPQTYPNAPQNIQTVNNKFPKHNQNHSQNFSRQNQSQPQNFPKPNQNQPNAPRGNLPKQNQGHQNSRNSNSFPLQYKAPSGAQRNDNKNNQPTQHNTEAMEEYSQEPDNSSFLSSAAGGKGIPGLDLVPEEKSKQQYPPIIDITDDNNGQSAPDYSNISRGINNILGDEKIMNILTNLNIIRDQTSAGPSQAINNRSVPPSGQNLPTSQGMPPGRNMPSGNYNMPHGVSMPSSGHNMPPNNYNNMPTNNRVPPNQNQWDNNHGPNNQMQQNQPPSNHHPNQRMYDDRGDYRQDNNYNEGQNMPPRNQMGQMGYRDARDGQNMNMGNPNMGGPNQGGPNRFGPNQGGPNMGGPNQGGPNVQAGQRGPQPLMSVRVNVPPRSQDMPTVPGQQNMEFSRPEPPPEPEQRWKEEPMFTPSIVVDYEHKPLRLKARDFIEPVHMFDYNHVSKEDEYKHKDYEREADDLFARDPNRPEIDNRPMYDRERDYMKETQRDYLIEPPRDYLREPPRDREYSRPRDFERRPPREELREDPYRPREELREEPFSRTRPSRDDYEDRKKRDDPFLRREKPRKESPGHRDVFSRRDGVDRRDQYSRRDDRREELSSRERDEYSRRDDGRSKRDRSRERISSHRGSHSRDISADSRKRGSSRDTDNSDTKRPKEATKALDTPKHVVMIDDILEPPGREMRPEKIVIILRGPPGSGKSYLAKLIRDREAEHGGTARIMSIDDYFMQEGEIEERDPNTGKLVKKPSLKYEYDASSEDTYLNSLKRAFKRTITDGYFNFLIYDAVNDQLKSYADMWNFARQNGFQVYVCTLELDALTCHARNVHARSLDDVQVIVARWFPTPAHHLCLDATSLLQSAAIQDVTMEDAVHTVDDEEAGDQVETCFTSKWEKMDDARQLARLDGTSRPLRGSQLSMEDYLQLDDWTPNKPRPGKKTVRWADLEERREQEKMRAIGFVVGQTDWGRMTDPSRGSSKLTHTKYIERVTRK